MTHQRDIEPGVFSTAALGRLFIIYYRVPTTLDYELRIAAAYLEHCRASGDRGVILALSDAPFLPLPPVEVRAHWRQFLDETASVEAIAAISAGLVGIAGAALTNLLEHVMGPSFGVPLRVFTSLDTAIAWLRSTTDLGVDDPDLLEQINGLRAST